MSAPEAAAGAVAAPQFGETGVEEMPVRRLIDAAPQIDPLHLVIRIDAKDAAGGRNGHMIAQRRSEFLVLRSGPTEAPRRKGLVLQARRGGSVQQDLPR